jgi:hypothetical protein
VNQTYHFRKTTRSDNVTSMDQAIEMTSGLFNLFAKVVVGVQIEDVRDQVHSVLVILHLGVETGKIETVQEVLLINLAKVLIATRRDELRNARNLLVSTGIVRTLMNLCVVTMGTDMRKYPAIECARLSGAISVCSHSSESSEQDMRNWRFVIEHKHRGHDRWEE